MPEDPPRSGTVVAVRSMSADEVVLSISDARPRRAAGRTASSSQFIDGERVRLRPWAVRYAAAGRARRHGGRRRASSLADRWEDFDRHPFEDDSPRHVSVYALSR